LLALAACRLPHAQQQQQAPLLRALLLRRLPQQCLQQTCLISKHLVPQCQLFAASPSAAAAVQPLLVAAVLRPAAWPDPAWLWEAVHPMMHAGAMSLLQVLPAALPAVGRQEHCRAQPSSMHAQLLSTPMHVVPYSRSRAIASCAVLLQQAQ
jgi:hypothetical protein